MRTSERVIGPHEVDDRWTIGPGDDGWSVGPSQLNPDVCDLLFDRGYTEAQWARVRGWDDGVWRGDVCGCSDDRCIGYHHEDTADYCECLLFQLADEEVRQEAAVIWADYRAAVEANNGKGDHDAYEATWARAEAWVRHNHPGAVTFSLDALVKGARGISVVYPRPDPGYVGSEPVDEGHHRMLVWALPGQEW